MAPRPCRVPLATVYRIRTFRIRVYNRVTYLYPADYIRIPFRREVFPNTEGYVAHLQSFNTDLAQNGVMYERTREEGTVHEAAAEYLDRVEDCVYHLHRFFEEYEEEGFQRHVAETVGAESDCDTMVSNLKKDVTLTKKTEPTGLYIKIPAVLRLLRTTDRVANTAEDTVRFTYATRPELPSDVGDRLTEMGENTVAATSSLTVAALRVLRSFEQPRSVDVSEEVKTVRDAESRCDRLKYDAVEAAFDELSTSDAAVVKDVVMRLDEVPNGVEDAVDVLLYLSTN